MSASFYSYNRNDLSLTRDAFRVNGDTVEVIEAVYTHLRREKAESAAEKLRKYHA